MAYVITQSMVGLHREGEVVDFPAEIDVQRLLNLGAIRPATEEDGTAVPYGQTGIEVPKPFPPVPFESVTSSHTYFAEGVPATTVTEIGAVRDESQPATKQAK